MPSMAAKGAYTMSIAITTTLNADDEAARNAYNTAFSQMEIGWHWDAATYRELLADGGQPVRAFVERHRPHLLRAYAIDCLVNAVEATRRDLRAPQSR
jgi:hypothetical protein